MYQRSSSGSSRGTFSTAPRGISMASSLTMIRKSLNNSPALQPAVKAAPPHVVYVPFVQELSDPIERERASRYGRPSPMVVSRSPNPNYSQPTPRQNSVPPPPTSSLDQLQQLRNSTPRRESSAANEPTAVAVERGDGEWGSVAPCVRHTMAQLLREREELNVYPAESNSPFNEGPGRQGAASRSLRPPPPSPKVADSSINARTGYSSGIRFTESGPREPHRTYFPDEELSVANSITARALNPRDMLASSRNNTPQRGTQRRESKGGDQQLAAPQSADSSRRQSPNTSVLSNASGTGSILRPSTYQATEGQSQVFPEARGTSYTPTCRDQSTIINTFGEASRFRSRAVRNIAHFHKNIERLHLEVQDHMKSQVVAAIQLDSQLMSRLRHVAREDDTSYTADSVVPQSLKEKLTKDEARFQHLASALAKLADLSNTFIRDFLSPTEAEAVGYMTAAERVRSASVSRSPVRRPPTHDAAVQAELIRTPSRTPERSSRSVSIEVPLEVSARSATPPNQMVPQEEMLFESPMATLVSDTAPTAASDPRSSTRAPSANGSHTAYPIQHELAAFTTRPPLATHTAEADTSLAIEPVVDEQPPNSTSDHYEPPQASLTYKVAEAVTPQEEANVSMRLKVTGEKKPAAKATVNTTPVKRGPSASGARPSTSHSRGSTPTGRAHTPTARRNSTDGPDDALRRRQAAKAAADRVAKVAAQNKAKAEAERLAQEEERRASRLKAQELATQQKAQRDLALKQQQAKRAKEAADNERRIAETLAAAEADEEARRLQAEGIVREETVDPPSPTKDPFITSPIIVSPNLNSEDTKVGLEESGSSTKSSLAKDLDYARVRQEEAVAQRQAQLRDEEARRIAEAEAQGRAEAQRLEQERLEEEAALAKVEADRQAQKVAEERLAKEREEQADQQAATAKKEADARLAKEAEEAARLAHERNELLKAEEARRAKEAAEKVETDRRALAAQKVRESPPPNGQSAPVSLRDLRGSSLTSSVLQQEQRGSSNASVRRSPRFEDDDDDDLGRMASRPTLQTSATVRPQAAPITEPSIGREGSAPKPSATTPSPTPGRRVIDLTKYAIKDSDSDED